MTVKPARSIAPLMLVPLLLLALAGSSHSAQPWTDQYQYENSRLAQPRTEQYQDEHSRSVQPRIHVVAENLNRARCVRTSPLGNVFVVESGRHRILKFSEQGNRIDSLGRLGSGDYQFDTPVHIEPTNELKIYVSDRNNRRIQVFDRRLQYLSTIALPARSGHRPGYRPSLVVGDFMGRIFFYDEERHYVHRLDSHGQLDLSFELFSEDERVIPGDMALSDDQLWVIGREGRLLHRFSASGSYLGFIFPPEPVRSLRVIQRELWILTEQHLLQIDRSGGIVQSVRLPSPGTTGSRRPAQWISFDIRGDNIWLLGPETLLRLVKQPEPPDH